MIDDTSFQKMPSLREDIFESIELQHLFYAISKFFPMIIYVNLTQNTYKMLEYESFTTKKASAEGVFDELINVGVSTVDPVQKNYFMVLFPARACSKLIPGVKPVSCWMFDSTVTTAYIGGSRPTSYS